MKINEEGNNERFLQIFRELCRIPHGSYHVDEISNFLYQKGLKNGNESIQDEYGNVIIISYATEGREEEPALILQAHMDMVTVKEADCTVDFEKEGLDIQTNGDFLYAKGTSLGADNGVAVAYCLALLEDNQLSHPRLEYVFTVNEEVGMEGACQINLSMLQGRRLLNLDSEEEGIFQTGCAGGVCAHIKLPVSCTEIHSVQDVENLQFFEIVVSGLTGGHSGTEIDRERANAVILMGRLLSELNQLYGQNEETFFVCSLNGGDKDNAIPTECRLVVAVRQSAFLVQKIENFKNRVREEYYETEKSIKIEWLMAREHSQVWTGDTIDRVVSFLTLVPNGVYSRNLKVNGLVETSQNVGVVASDENFFCCDILVRSMTEERKGVLVKKNEMLADLLGGTTQLFSDYPGWEYKPISPLRDHLVAVYKEQYGSNPEVTVVHAGLECGILSSKFDNLDCISLGPNIIDIHTTKERLSISSAKRVWKFLQTVIEKSEC